MDLCYILDQIISSLSTCYLGCYGIKKNTVLDIILQQSMDGEIEVYDKLFQYPEFGEIQLIGIY